jgi:hypothetical protein
MNEGWKHLYGVIDGSGEFNFPSEKRDLID